MRMVKWILKSYKILALVILVIVTFFSIHPNFDRRGAFVVVSGVKGIKEGDIVVKVNGIEIDRANDMSKVPNSSFYKITFKREVFPYIYVTKEVYSENLNLKVVDVPLFKIKFGIDLAGGSRILLKPNESATDEELKAAKEIIERRLDFYGLKGADVRIITGFSGKYIQVEMAGSPEEILEIIKKQGKLEAKIGNVTVFTGKDIVSVCTTASAVCTPQIYKIGEIWEGRFGIVISKEAAERFANLTKDLDVVCYGKECYLSKTLDIYLDNRLVNSLNIASELKGKVVTNPAISMRGETREEVEYKMRVLQSILMNGELPITLTIERIDRISPVYGKAVFSNIMLVWILSIIAVGVVVFFRYKNPKISLLMFSIMLIETFSTFGVAALIGWTIDIASLAGIIAAVGTGLDDQIIMTEEVLYGKKIEEGTERSLKKAFFIIIASFSVSLMSMMPLLFAGAGILKGFAITNIIGLVIGITITRPAYGEILKRIA